MGNGAMVATIRNKNERSRDDGGRSVMRFSILLLCAAGLACRPSTAAEFELLGNQVVLTGEIVKGDSSRFISLARSLPPGTIVRLQSPGGLAFEGMAIGKHVRERAFNTYVHYGRCASACGLIWLGGVEKWINPRAYVGFHQSFDPGTGKATVPGNAIVGHYMAKLGYGRSAVIFATSLGPKRWRG